MLNRVILIGRLTKEPDLRYTPNGVAVAKFTLAIDRPPVKDREKETDFIDVVVWQAQAENCSNHLVKGQRVAVEGRLQIRSYDDSQGVRRKAAEVVANRVIFLDKPKGNSGQQYDDGYSFDDSDIPF